MTTTFIVLLFIFISFGLFWMKIQISKIKIELDVYTIRLSNIKQAYEKLIKEQAYSKECAKKDITQWVTEQKDHKVRIKKLESMLTLRNFK